MSPEPDPNPNPETETKASQAIPETNSVALNLTPEDALSLLCANVERLGNTNSYSPLEAVTSAFNRITGRGVSDEASPIRVTELELHIDADGSGSGSGGHDSVQQSVLTKRFLSKKEPPIPLKEYLLRIHRYCPMSVAVYLATSIYLTKMATIDNIITINPKNMHRLVLAGLRVAMKALEDLSYPHNRFAKVGGVTERELSKLEISFCFLADFELRVDAEMLEFEVSTQVPTRVPS